MKKLLCILAISITTIIHTVIIADRITIAGLIGSLLPSTIIGLLFAKYLDKKADKKKELVTFTISYCIFLFFVIIGNSGLLK